MKKTFAFLALVAVDQMAKSFASRTASSFKFIKYICNKNIAWSISITPAIFYVSWVIIFFLLLFFLFKGKPARQKFALILILSGAASNMFDRIIHGYVIDFIDLKFWPVFNLADIYITMGVVLLFFGLIKNNRREATP